MKLVSVSGIVCYVKDVNKTAKFYKALGFKIRRREKNQLSIYLNWFWMVFQAQGKETKTEFKKEARLTPRGGGMYIYIKVDDVDAYYKNVLKKKIKPSSAPRDWPWGNREFALRDPDGYKLVFFNES